jgi:hypothetical protein
MQQQVQSSNNATEYIYQSCVHLLEETGMKISMMLWDSIVLKAKKFKEFEGYEMSLLDMTFDVRVNMINDDQSRAELTQLMNTALAAGMITYEQAFKIKHIEDVKLAELYLARSMKKAKKEAQETAQQNAQMNAQIQQESAAAKSQGDAQLEQMMAESKIAVNKSKNDGDKEIELIKFATTMYASVVGKGIELPAELKQFADTILGNAIQPQMQEQAAQQAAMEQQMMAEEQAPMEGQPMEVTEEQITEEMPPQ